MKGGDDLNIDNRTGAWVRNLQEDSWRKNTMFAFLSTYEGKDQEGESRYSDWRTHFVGEAYGKAKRLSNNDKIILRKAKVECTGNKEKKDEYVTVTVFDFEVADESRDE